MAPEDDTPAPASPPPASRSDFVAIADVFGHARGALLSLTPAQAAEGGEAVRPASDADRSFKGVPPIQID